MASLALFKQSIVKSIRPHSRAHWDDDSSDALLADLRDLFLAAYNGHDELARRRRLIVAKRRGRAPNQPRSRAGRKPGSINFRLRQLGHGLAVAWRTHSGHEPTRSVAIDDGREFGPFRGFVEAVHDAINDSFGLGSVPLDDPACRRAINRITRLGIESYRAARASLDPTSLLLPHRDEGDHDAAFPTGPSATLEELERMEAEERQRASAVITEIARDRRRGRPPR